MRPQHKLLKLLLSNLVIANLFFSSFLLAENQISLLYTGANPDWKRFDTEYGYSVTAQYHFENGLFVSGFYNDTDFRASGPEVGGVNVESWLETGIGYAFENQWGQFYSLITFEMITAKNGISGNKTYEGVGAHFGYIKPFTENWKAILQFGYLDTEFHDYQLEAKLNYALSDNFSFSFGLRDYDDWDYTSYESGLIYRF